MNELIDDVIDKLVITICEHENCKIEILAWKSENKCLCIKHKKLVDKQIEEMKVQYEFIYE